MQRVERSYTRERKIEVLLFRHHYYVQDLDEYSNVIGYCKPTFREMGVFWMIPWSTIGNWWRNQEAILQSRGGSCQINTVWVCAWPKMEQQLYTEFIQRRLEGKLVQRSWFRRRSKQLFVHCYNGSTIFVFSNSWFQGFCKRFGISLRAVTRQV